MGIHSPKPTTNISRIVTLFLLLFSSIRAVRIHSYQVVIVTISKGKEYFVVEVLELTKSEEIAVDTELKK